MHRVHIEFQRVQTWLFAVPRLRAMVGANTLLGEVLRVLLPALAREQSSWQLAMLSDDYPSAVAIDPLADHDDPASDARNGIISRDGGHFEAYFESGAYEFATAAAEFLWRELPGLLFQIEIDDEEQRIEGAAISTELPVLTPCEWTGRGLASEIVKQGDEPAAVSLDVSRRHDAARSAEGGQASDLASLLVATTKLREFSQAQTFKDLVGSGYLALIHADGNDVGKRAHALKGVDRDAFFHRNRVLLRRAMQKAIDVACEDASSAPLIPLMLGGDDLLLVCRAGIAPRFVVELCKALEECQRTDASSFNLTLGVGVVIAKRTIPIHRLHEVAERLAASAKRRFRGFAETKQRSVVDWAVYTTSWLDDPEEIRQRDWVRGTDKDRRILSRRPIDVLGDGLDSLQSLLDAAGKIKDVPRSQLRYLVEQLPRGRMLSDLAFAELSPKARKALEGIGIHEVWSNLPGSALLTSVLDLVEVYEISRLGRAVSDDKSKSMEESAHGQ